MDPEQTVTIGELAAIAGDMACDGDRTLRVLTELISRAGCGSPAEAEAMIRAARADGALPLRERILRELATQPDGVHCIKLAELFALPIPVVNAELHAMRDDPGGALVRFVPRRGEHGPRWVLTAAAAVSLIEVRP